MKLGSSDRARFTFVELNIHENSYNFVPANLSFLINEKRNYLTLRRGLQLLARTTETPTEEDLRTMARKYGVVYKPLPMTAIVKGLRFASGIAQTAHIDSTPTAIVINQRTGATRMFQGDRAITLDAVTKAVHELSRAS